MTALGSTTVTAMPAKTFFDETRKLVVPRLGEIIRELGHVRMGKGGALWRYDEGVYRSDGEAFVRATVRSCLGDACRKLHFDEVLTWLRSFPVTITDDQDTEMVNVANGLLNWRTGDLAGHDPDVVSTAQIPVEWNPDAVCPAVDRFLSEVLPDDAVEFVIELIGYSLYAGNPLRKAVLLLGPGGNGKSRLLLLIRALLGTVNCSAVPLQQLAENRFAAAELFGKLANLAGDLDARAMRRTDQFKQLTGGDPVQAERKFGHPFTFVCKAIPIFSANEAPVSSDQTQAYFDRFLLVPMTRRFEGTPGCDPNILARITTRAELEGLLVRAVRGLGFLMERGAFDPPPSVRDAGSAYRERLDTAAGFIRDECVVHQDAWTPRTTLYSGYRKWCEDTGRLPIMAENFYDHLRSNLIDKVEERGRRGIRGFAGIGLLTDRQAP